MQGPSTVRRARLHDLRIVRPRHESEQAATLAWLAEAHAVAARTAGEEDARSAHDMARLLGRFGCNPTKIARRGHELEDFLHREWEAMRVYDLTRDPDGADVRVRSQLHMAAAERALAVFYDHDTPPDDLVHVTCTGYASPSAAQRLVASRGWGARTRVLHAYHMGCYAAVPALRIAEGLVRSRSARSRVDVVHTEVCSLHLHPRDHSPEQLVVQSLFADGHAHYALSNEPVGEPSYEVLSASEHIAADSAESMTWTLGAHGMAMTLARDVPARIGGALGGFVRGLYAEAGITPKPRFAGDVFAVHPGGPRIIDAVESALELTEPQVAASRSVLLRHGNMSSATLPHVWKDVLDDDAVPSGTLVLSLAFGPGLTLAGALLRKA